jgi:hypothetical protein
MNADGARVSHPQRVVCLTGVGTSFDLPLPSARCGWGQLRSEVVARKRSRDAFF